MTPRGLVRALRAGMLLASVTMFSSLANAQPAPPRVRITAAAGVFRPAEEVFRDVYGGSEATWLVQVDVSVAGPVGVFGGLRRLSRDGRTVAESASDVTFDTTLDVTSVRFGAGAGGRVGRVVVAGRFGADYNTGDEKWPELDMSASIDAWGWLAQGSVEVPVWRRLAAIGLIEFGRTSVETESSPDEAQIGGLTLAAGVVVGF